MLNRYLAKKGYGGQLTDEQADPKAPDNLFDPVRGDPGTHGRFDSRATSRNPHLWATEHRTALIAAGLTLAGFIVTMLVGARPAAARQKEADVREPTAGARV